VDLLQILGITSQFSILLVSNHELTINSDIEAKRLAVRFLKAMGEGPSLRSGYCQTEVAEDPVDFVEVAGGGVFFDQTAGGEAEDGDLFGEALEGGGFEVGELALLEAAGVEAVAEGVGVAGLAAARAAGGTFTSFGMKFFVHGSPFN
jgi:hypothetical protein